MGALEEAEEHSGHLVIVENLHKNVQYFFIGTYIIYIRMYVCRWIIQDIKFVIIICSYLRTYFLCMYVAIANVFYNGDWTALNVDDDKKISLNTLTIV